MFKIFSSVNVLNYEWEIITDDIFYPKDSKRNDDFFSSNIVDGQSFLNSIMKDNYHMIFVDLKAFPINSCHRQIKYFKDFLESDCQIILLCIDSIFIEFYCKDKDILNTVYNNCKKFKFESVEYLTDEEASKRSMIAF